MSGLSLTISTALLLMLFRPWNSTVLFSLKKIEMLCCGISIITLISSYKSLTLKYNVNVESGIRGVSHLVKAYDEIPPVQKAHIF